MSIFKNFKEDGAMIVRMLRVQFSHATMSKAQEKAYQDIVKSLEDLKGGACWVTVPAHVLPKDAEKALKAIRLEMPGDVQVTWESQPGKKTILSEKPPQP